MNALKKVERALDKFFEGGFYLCGILLAILLTLCFFNVALRLMNQPLSWSDEAMRFLMIWMAFLACPVLINRNEHLVVDLVATVFRKEAMRKRMYFIGNVMLLAFLIFLFFPCVELVMKNMISKSSAMRIPMGYIYLCIPVSIALSVIAQLKLLCHEIFLRGKDGDKAIGAGKGGE